MTPNVWTSVAAAALIAAVACGSNESPTGAGARATASPAGAAATPTATPGPAQAPGEDEAGGVQRPRPGMYVYSLVGRGETGVPEGSELREDISVEGDVYTSDITNNQNDNTRRIRQRWEADRLLLLSNDTLIGGRRSTCAFDPPVVAFHIPLRAEKLDAQELTGEGTACGGTIEIEVTGREEVPDATGRMWVAWRIVAETARGGTTTTEIRWFSPELGHDVRIQTTSVTPGGTNETETALVSYPS